MLDADITDSVIGEGCVIKVRLLENVMHQIYYTNLNFETNIVFHTLLQLVMIFRTFITSVQNCKIHHSVIGLRSCISEGAIIEDTLLMGADYYEVCAISKKWKY